MIRRLLKKLLNAFIYFILFALIYELLPILFIPISLYLIFKLYKNDFFTKLLVKFKIRKEYKKIRFINKIHLYEFEDKKINEYKKQFISLTNDKITIIGYNSIKSELYKKDFEIKDIKDIYFGNLTDTIKYDSFDIKTSYRTVTNKFGTYDEKVEERIPTTRESYKTDFGYVDISFQNIEEKKVCFDFGEHKDRYTLPIRFRRKCKKVGIKNLSKIHLN